MFSAHACSQGGTYRAKMYQTPACAVTSGDSIRRPALETSTIALVADGISRKALVSPRLNRTLARTG